MSKKKGAPAKMNTITVTMAGANGASVVEDPICPKCPTHKVGKSLYCGPCGKEYDKIVSKEEDPNFACQVCRDDPNLDPPHATCRTFTVIRIFDAIVDTID